jgi:hypothetical protein
MGMSRPIPLWTVASFAALTAVHAVTNDSAVFGLLRLSLVIAFSGAILLGPLTVAIPKRRASETS